MPGESTFTSVHPELPYNQIGQLFFSLHILESDRYYIGNQYKNNDDKIKIVIWSYTNVKTNEK